MIKRCLALEPDNPPRLATPRRYVGGAEAVATQVVIRLVTLRGSWTEDSLLGLAWLDWLVVSPLSTIRTLAERQVYAVPGVTSAVVTPARTGSRLTLSARCQIEVGDEVAQVEVGPLGIYGEYVPGAWYRLITLRHRHILGGAP